MMKKFTSLAAVVLLVLSLAACGSTNAAPTAASVSQSVSASSAASESSSVPESESASSSQESTDESVSTSTATSEAASATATAANNLTGIALSSNGGLLYVGYSASAKVYTTPYEAPAANAAEVKYTSSNESVVTVTPNTSGAAGFMVQGVAPGTATVTVEYQGHTAEYSVTVQKYVAPVKTSSNKNSGTNTAQGSTTPSAQAPAATAPVTQSPAATAPTAPAPTTPTETPQAPGLYDANGQPATQPAPGEGGILYDEDGHRVVFGPLPDGTPIGDDDRIGGNGFDWGAVNGGDATDGTRS